METRRHKSEKWALNVDPVSKRRILSVEIHGQLAGRINYIEVESDKCHILSVVVQPKFQRQGIATDGIAILMTKYRYFSAEPLNDKITELFSQLAQRDDVTAWPRVARWDGEELHYLDHM